MYNSDQLVFVKVPAGFTHTADQPCDNIHVLCTGTRCILFLRGPDADQFRAGDGALLW